MRPPRMRPLVTNLLRNLPLNIKRPVKNKRWVEDWRISNTAGRDRRGVVGRFSRGHLRARKSVQDCATSRLMTENE